jgi:hypothetical protein
MMNQITAGIDMPDAHEVEIEPLAQKRRQAWAAKSAAAFVSATMVVGSVA